MNIGGCMCKFCEAIVFDTTIEDIGIRLENEIGSFRGFRAITYLSLKMR